MTGKKLEPLQQIKRRRDGALDLLVSGVPYLEFLGVKVDRCGDELTVIMPFSDTLIGNPLLPALHGGATAAFLETTAVLELGWVMIWENMERGEAGDPAVMARPELPKTIDFTVDYLRSGKPYDAYARARVTRRGRRYASVHVEAWQDHRARLFAQATGHFLMPDG